MQNNSREAKWRDLMAKSQKGDSAAYQLLLREVAAFLRGYFIKRISNTADIEDLVQEILISIHKAMPTYTPERSFTPWMLAIANFRKADYLRQHYAAKDNLKAPIEVLDFAENVTNEAAEYEYKDIEKAMAALPPKHRRLLDLVKIQGYTANEAAKKTGMSESAVKVSIHRSIQKLKSNFKGH